MRILTEVNKLGQQIWLDNLSRSLIQSGELAKMMQQGIAGVTSNPAIFQKAFAEDALYTEEITQFKQKNVDAKTIYEQLAIADVQAACDVCAPIFVASAGKAGFVSLEVAPELSHNAIGTVVEAMRLHQAIDRANVMIKVPATDEGLLALTELVAKGINVNLTLLFSRQQTQKAYQAYLAGLEKRKASGKAIHTIQVVASFFISRIDSALDPTLPEHLNGKIALALAKAAYHDWQQFFTSEAFAPLAAQGANKVSLLWASTGVKNPAYADTLYMDNLIAEHTINTVPEKTLAAFVDHGKAARTLPENLEEAFACLQQVQDLGIDVEVLATRLQHDGLTQFEQAFAKLLAPLR